MTVRRGLIWGLLVAGLLVVAAAALVQRMRQSDLPDLGEVPAFSLENRDGRTIRLDDLRGTPWVADFIFTRCPASCPMLSARVARLDRELPPDLGVQFVSISVDPAYDTPEVLQRHAQKLGASDRWLFLTGNREEIRRLSIEGFKLGLDLDPAPGSSSEPILHSTRFVLIDGRGTIRGYYEAFDEASMERLRRDLESLAGR